MKKKKKRRLYDEDDKLSRTQLIELATKIYASMVEGCTEEEIIEELGISAEHYGLAKRVLLQSKGDAEERLSPKERFAQYIIDQQRNVVDLTDLVNSLDNQKQYSAVVGAIRLRHEIENRVIETGQTLGIISKEPERKVIVGGISVADMRDADLRKGVLVAIGGLSKLIDKYGTGSNVRELAPGPLHHGEAVVSEPAAALEKPPMAEASGDKKNRAKSGKRSAGRRRVRE